MNIEQVTEAESTLAGAVKSRFNDVQTKAAREKRLKDVEEKGVLAAAGMAAAVRRTAHMSVAEGATLPIMAAAAAAPGTTAPEALNFEATIGLDDTVPINFLTRGRTAARAVCRLSVNGQPIGTGFLVAPGVLLTNHHVIPSAEEAATFAAEFDYELDDEDQPRQPIVRFALEPDRLFATSPSQGGLDFTFVAVAARSTGREAMPIAAFGHLPLDPRTDKILVGEPILILQHPRGDPKRAGLFRAELVDRVDQFLHYTTDTAGGASGSPATNRSWQVVGLHHASFTTKERRRGVPVVVNEGIRVSWIIRALQGEPLIPGGASVVTGDAAEVLAAVQRPDVIGDGRPQAPRVAPTAAAAALAESALGRIEERTSIRVRPANHFDQRDPEHLGYKSDFLGAGARVPLPTLPPHLRDDVAKPRGGGIELRYTHYSTVHSASRRLPILTAVNIDGASLRKRGRKQRDFEAADVWYYDPRIESRLQLDGTIYDGTPFDFGHMVRREDPIWGDDNTATMANDDTFYMTNAAPQHHDLNTQTWLRLENAMLSAARENEMRISVFTGPVLSPQDPVMLGVQVPTAFWKIVAYVQDGALRAQGFMQWQTQLVEDLDLETLDQLGRVAEFQVSIRQIAQDTGLSFGPLEAADEFAGPERPGRPRRRRLNERLREPLFNAGSAAPVPQRSGYGPSGNGGGGVAMSGGGDGPGVGSGGGNGPGGINRLNGIDGEPGGDGQVHEALCRIRDILRELLPD